MAADAPQLPTDSGPSRKLLIWVIVIAAAVLILRSLLIAHAQSPTYDVEPQLRTGLRFWSGDLAGRAPNDPPFGAAITALPLWLLGCRADAADILYAQPISVETILLITAAWRAILFVPAIVVAMRWAWQLYGKAAGLFASALLLADPNFAGLIAIGTADALAAEASFLCLYCFWRYLARPSLSRLASAAVLLGIALSIKHNAAIAALSAVILAMLWLHPRHQRRPPQSHLAHAAFAAGILVLTIWCLTLFDISTPAPAQADVGQTGLRLPAGAYIGSFIRGLRHNDWGHPAYLLGQESNTGWWYYFPILCTYKVPLGTAIILAAAAVSFLWRRPRWDELSLLVPLLIGLAFMMYARINTGFRHFLPVYILLFPLCGRLLAPADHRTIRIPAIIACAGLLATILHAASYHPDYLVYINAPRPTPAYLAISDSNTDWGQGLKQVAIWLDQHPSPTRSIYLRYFGRGTAGIKHYLVDRVRPLTDADPIPRSGRLIISPVYVAGAYDHHYAFLRERHPSAVIGHSLLVYDLDAMASESFGGGLSSAIMR